MSIQECLTLSSFQEFTGDELRCQIQMPQLIRTVVIHSTKQLTAQHVINQEGWQLTLSIALLSFRIDGVKLFIIAMNVPYEFIGYAN